MDLNDIIKKTRNQLTDPARAQDEAEVISKYGSLFNPRNIDNITADNFRTFLSYSNNKHWDGLESHGPGISQDIEKFRRTLKILLDENLPIDRRIMRIRISSLSN